MNNILEFYTTLNATYQSNGLNKFAVLRLAVTNPDMKDIYLQHIEKHNHSVLTDPFPNSGFDLFIPNQVTFDREFQSKFIDLQVKAEMIYVDVHFSNQQMNYCAFLIHPRSSISKTPLMLANHTGIIDSGYRGSLITAFRCLQSYVESYYIVEKNTRLVQVCHPSLCPILVQLVDESELTSTVRGEGGFGSTDK
jgi:dUTPase